VHPLEVVVDEHAHREAAEGHREDEVAPTAPEHPRGRPRLPGGARDDHGGEHPAPVEQRAGFVGVCRDAIEVEAVRHAEDDEACHEHGPRPAEAADGERHEPDGERDQHEVAQRIGEVGGDRERRPAGRGHDLAEGDRGTHGRDREPTDHAVEPRDL
jgi:hypothetical protein